MIKPKIFLEEFDGDYNVNPGFTIHIEFDIFKLTSSYRTPTERLNKLAKMRARAKEIADAFGVKVKENLNPNL